MNVRVLVFTLLICGLAAIFSSTAPALIWFRSDVNELLKESGRGGSQSTRPSRLRGVLVILEVAMATLSLVGAGLFLRSLGNARSIYPGFDRNNVVLVRFYPDATGFQTRDLVQFFARLRERLLTDPAIQSASYADFAPLGSNAGPYSEIQVEGYVPAAKESMEINRSSISPGYFDTLRIPLLEGRDFNASDDNLAPPILIVNHAFEQRYFRGMNALGHKVRWRSKWRTIVGVVADNKSFNISETPRPHYFAPFHQEAGNDLQTHLFIKTRGDPESVMGGLRRQIAGAGANAPPFDVMMLTAWTEVTLLTQRAAAGLLAVLGGVAVILATVGLYSVMAYAVSQRTHEIGIRMALGARPGDVVREVIRQGMTLTLIGLAGGIAAALMAARLVASMLVEVGAADLRTFAGAAVFLTAIALLATYIPARRATKTDPMAALHTE
jgi:predicted permease